MDWAPHCDAGRVARWRQIDEERAARAAESLEPRQEVVILPPRAKQPTFDHRRWGRAIDGSTVGGGYRVLRGPRSSG